jgi:hypothetical protein
VHEVGRPREVRQPHADGLLKKNFQSLANPP